MDASRILREHAETTDIRLIGGLMMEIHRLRWGLGPELIRETRDADFGTPLLAMPVFEDVESALDSLGYKPNGQYRYERPVLDLAMDAGEKAPLYVATIDIVQARPVPIDGSPSVQAGSGAMDPVAIVEALSRPPVDVHLTLTRRNGESSSLSVPLADEASAVILKAYAWRARRHTRDVHDLWRTLTIAHRAQCGPADFLNPAGRSTASIIETAFGGAESEAIEYLATTLGEPSESVHTQIRALRQRLGL